MRGTGLVVVALAFGCGHSNGTADTLDGGAPDARNDDAPSPTGSRFELRVLDPQISADGHSKVPVLAIGTDAGGNPSTLQVVLNTSRAGAGTFDRPAPTLDAFGATVYFTPCNATTPGCTGPVDLTLALASDPATQVASVAVNLVTPTGVGSAAPCLAGGNSMFFDGDDYIYNGMMNVTQGSFGASGSANALSIHVVPSSQMQGLWWDLDFNTQQLGVPLAEGVYEMAQRAPFAQPGHPGLEVSGDGRGCNTISGRFQVESFIMNGSGVQSATVSFEQHCDETGPALNGCIHYEAP